MNKISEVMNKFDHSSVVRVIQSASQSIQGSSDQLAAANAVITAFGIKPVREEDVARVVALALVETAFDRGTELPTEEYITAAMGRFAKQATKLNVYSQDAITLLPLKKGETVVMHTEAGDKQAKARVIYDKMIGSASKNAIVKEIAKQLNITIGNAGFIVYRKFAGKK